MTCFITNLEDKHILPDADFYFRYTSINPGLSMSNPYTELSLDFISIKFHMI